MNEEGRPWRWAAAAVRLILLTGLALWAAGSLTAGAKAATLIPVGRAVGIKLFSDGVVVVGTSEIVTAQGAVNPARACGLKEGDIITRINSTEVDTIEEVSSLLQELEGASMRIRAIRDEREVELTARAVYCLADGTYKLGAWIRDSMAGIGTVTFYCPETGRFGALGHGINDVDTALLMPLERGEILPASVVAVQKGVSGTPGQLRGMFDGSVILGELTHNTPCGVFGLAAESPWTEGRKLETAARDEVKAGKATILSSIAGEEVASYEIRILKVYPAGQGGGRDFLIRVTDPRLLGETGGIVQGMSGSPIIQDGKLVGAVTHVMVDDPSEGYGIWIGNMLEAAG